MSKAAVSWWDTDLNNWEFSVIAGSLSTLWWELKKKWCTFPQRAYTKSYTRVLRAWFTFMRNNAWPSLPLWYLKSTTLNSSVRLFLTCSSRTLFQGASHSPNQNGQCEEYLKRCLSKEIMPLWTCLSSSFVPSRVLTSTSTLKKWLSSIDLIMQRLW